MFTEKQKEKALELHRNIKSISKVIKILGYPTRQTMYHWINNRNNPIKNRAKVVNANMPDHPRHPTVELKLEIIKRCFENGEDIKTAAKEVEYSRMSIYKWHSIFL